MRRLRGDCDSWAQHRHLLWWHLANLIGRSAPPATADRNCRWPVGDCTHRIVDLDD